MQKARDDKKIAKLVLYWFQKVGKTKTKNCIIKQYLNNINSNETPLFLR